MTPIPSDAQSQFFIRPDLPATLTSFVGRRRELAEIRDLLTCVPLLNLTGTGGCGKTRIALQIGQETASTYTDGVIWVELARLTDPVLVPQALAKALNISEQPKVSLVDTLVEVVHSKDLLLIFDNCEHLLDACAQLAHALMRSGSVHLLTTSREPLGVVGETIYPVSPLALPAEHFPFAELGQVEAVQLFVERARSIRLDFGLTPENHEIVAALCSDLDGIPLAIELAAARIGVLTVQQIQERLNRRLDLLVSGSRVDQRHRTLRAALDWSYELLSLPEQLLLARLSVFVSGFTLNAAETVCGWGAIERTEVLDLLSALINKSLVTAETLQGSEARYHLLETVRQYAEEKLVAADEQLSTQSHFLECFLWLTEDIVPKLRGQYQQLWLNWLETENGNLRAALGWALEQGRIEAGLRMATALYSFWEVRGYVREGLNWFSQLLARADDTLLFEVYVNSLVFASFLAMFLREGEQATVFGQKAVDLCEAAGEAGEVLLNFALAGLGSASQANGDYQAGYDISLRLIGRLRGINDSYNLGMTLFVMGIFATALGKYEAAHQHLDESLLLARDAHDSYRVANILKAQGELHRCEGNFSEAQAAYVESLALYQQINAKNDIPDVQRHLAYVSLHEGDTDYAGHLFQKVLLAYKEHDNQQGMAQTLLGFAALAAQIGQMDKSARLLGFLWDGALAKLFRPISADRITLEQTQSQIQKILGISRFEGEQVKGRGLSKGQAIELALSILSESVTSVTEPHDQAHSLTPREREVAALIGQGLSNSEIADALVLSKRTVEHHIASILSKLGFTNRAQIVRFAIENRLSSHTA